MFQLLVFDGWRRACGCYPFLACTRRLCLSEREGCAEAALNIDWQFNDNLFDDKPDLTPIAAMSAFTGAWTFNQSTGRLSVYNPKAGRRCWIP